MASRKERSEGLRAAIDWGELAPLHLRARLVADGIFAGSHRSARRGAGVEFAGHRVYVPGDELRFIDVRASLRHERVVVRHFETETERALRLVVDATTSMGFRGKGAPAAKFAFASVLAAALTRVAIASGDPVGLDWIGGDNTRRVPPSARAETFERVVAMLESARTGGDARARSELLEEGLGVAVRGARRGSAIVVFSDLLDLPDDAPEALAALGMRGRPLCVVEVLDPEEATFPFEGPIRLRALESGPNDVVTVQTDAPTVRDAYLAKLDARAAVYRDALARHGGALVRSVTTDDPVTVARAILHAIARPPQAEKADEP
jgi:uncharacterized protein (DUF58 family)